MSEENLTTEKCICCNGTGKGQEFDNTVNMWKRNDSDCKECKGTGKITYREFDVVGGSGHVHNKRKIRL